MRFRLFRSRAFWFGVPGLVGLLWGWWVSMGNLSLIGFSGFPPWVIGQIGGDAYALWDSEAGPDWRAFQMEHTRITGDQACEMRMASAAFRVGEPTFRHVFVPYGWLVLGYLAMWAGLLIWRKRRYDKLPVE